MQRDLWKHKYETFPPLPCPACRLGRLTASKQHYNTLTPSFMVECYREHTPELIDGGRFHQFLVCHLEKCGEVVSVLGDYFEESDFRGRDYNGDPIVDEKVEFTVVAMYPAPEIIMSSPKLADIPKMHLLKSYELFWIDLGSCANRLRIVVEMVLDQLGVPREVLDKNGLMQRKTLHWRITDLDKKKPGHQAALQALREVGNLGSHDGNAGIEEVLDSYELLEATFEELLDDKSSRLASIASSLTARQGKSAP